MTPTLCTFRVGHHQRYPPWSVHPLPYPLLFWQGRESRATAPRDSAASQNLVVRQSAAGVLSSSHEKWGCSWSMVSCPNCCVNMAEMCVVGGEGWPVSVHACIRNGGVSFRVSGSQPRVVARHFEFGNVGCAQRS